MKSSHFGHVAFIVLGLLLGLVLGYTVGAYYEAAKEAEDTASVQTTTVKKTTPTPSASTTADWKTYSNNEFNFSFKYPPDWTLTDKHFVNNQDKVITLSSSETVKHLGQVTSPSSYIQDDIAIRYSSTKNITAMNNGSYAMLIYVQGHYNDNTTAINLEKATINGVTFNQMTVAGDPSYFCALADYNNKLYELDFANHKTFSELSTTEKSILNSFTISQ